MKIMLAILHGRKGYRTIDGELRKYHLWNNGDTECRSYKSGGLGDVMNINLKFEEFDEYIFKQMRKNGKICVNCVSNSRKLGNSKKKINSIEPKEFLWQDIIDERDVNWEEYEDESE